MPHMRLAIHNILIVALATLFLPGCGAVRDARKAAERSQRSNKMKQMGLALHDYHDAKKQGPPGWSEFIAWVENAKPEYVAALKELQSEGVVFYCDVKFSETTGGTANAIFAYEASAPKSEGIVLLLDGSVHYMTAAEFTTMLTTQQKESPKSVEKKTGR